MKWIEDYLTKILSLKFNKELGFAMGIFVNSRDIQLLINNRNETLECSSAYPPGVGAKIFDAYPPTPSPGGWVGVGARTLRGIRN